MIRRTGILLLFLTLSAGAGWSLVPVDVLLPPEGRAFREVWGYLAVGEESSWRDTLPVSDLAYFSASLNSWGELTGIPDIRRLKAFTGRKHLVVALLENAAQTHMVLHPGFSVRDTLLEALAQAAAPYDGLQLDFESVGSRDKESFWSFLGQLKLRLPDKILSVAVPARTTLTDDAYDYRQLDRLVDRVIIMAYDEHWSAGPPGPVASLEWGKKVARFSQSVIGPSRLVLGIPFYGRAWADKSLSRAYKASGIARILSLLKPAPLHRSGGIPNFEYEETVRVRVFFDDRESHQARIDLYGSLGLKNLAFWRLGQESPDFWPLIRLAPESGER